MGWTIFGLVSLCVILTLWKNCYETRIYRKGVFEYKDKLRLPLWFLILLIIALLIPVVSIIVDVVIFFVLTRSLIEDELYIHFNDRTILGRISNFFKRIGKFLNKDVF